MKLNYTHIAILLDRSGSMGSIAKDMEGGLKAFLDEQKNIPGELTISLTRFDHEYTPVFVRKPISEIGEINIDPRGMTALIDSACFMIKDVGTDLDSLSEDQKPEKVLFIIITDGEENASTKYTNSDLKELITQQESLYNWNFVFIGANQDAFANGSRMGICASSSLNYDASTLGVKAMYRSVTDATTRYRGASADFSFTDEEQEKSENGTV